MSLGIIVAVYNDLAHDLPGLSETHLFLLHEASHAPRRIRVRVTSASQICAGVLFRLNPLHNMVHLNLLHCRRYKRVVVERDVTLLTILLW